MPIQIERLAVVAELDEPEPALVHARQAAERGDCSYARWLEEQERGEALVVRLHVTLTVRRGDGSRRLLRRRNTGVWVERSPHPAQVEGQVAEIIGKDFSSFAAELHEEGLDLPPDALTELAVHVELDASVQRLLSAMGADLDIDRRAPGGRDSASA